MAGLHKPYGSTPGVGSTPGALCHVLHTNAFQYLLIYPVHWDVQCCQAEARVHAGEVGQGQRDDAARPREVREGLGEPKY
jgi:hypothetical protein